MKRFGTSTVSWLGCSLLRGHPLMTFTQRGRRSGSDGQMRTGERVSYMWTSTQKIWAHWRHPVFFSCKEVGIFLPEFRLWTE